MYTGKLYFLVPQELLEKKQSRSEKRRANSKEANVNEEKNKEIREELRTIFADARNRRKIFLLMEMLFSNRDIKINSDHDVLLSGNKKTAINAIELLHRLSSPGPLTKEVKQFLLKAQKEKLKLPQV
jgi:hypothetical protein